MYTYFCRTSPPRRESTQLTDVSDESNKSLSITNDEMQPFIFTIPAVPEKPSKSTAEIPPTPQSTVSSLAQCQDNSHVVVTSNATETDVPQLKLASFFGPALPKQDAPLTGQKGEHSVGQLVPVALQTQAKSEESSPNHSPAKRVVEDEVVPITEYTAIESSSSDSDSEPEMGPKLPKHLLLKQAKNLKRPADELDEKDASADTVPSRMARASESDDQESDEWMVVDEAYGPDVPEDDSKVEVPLRMTVIGHDGKDTLTVDNESSESLVDQVLEQPDNCGTEARDQVSENSQMETSDASTGADGVKSAKKEMRDCGVQHEPEPGSCCAQKKKLKHFR